MFFFFFNDTATTEIYTLSLHDALPISRGSSAAGRSRRAAPSCAGRPGPGPARPLDRGRSEEHTSELQSRRDLVCRLLLEKKKKTTSGQRSPTDCIRNIIYRRLTRRRYS